VVGVVEASLRGVGVWEEARARRALPLAVATDTTVVCAGDSVTWGFPDGPQQSWPSFLAAASSGISVVNLGRSGSGQAEAIARVSGFLAERHGGRALVLYLAGFNDCANRPPINDSAIYMETARILWKSRTFRLLRQLVVHLDGSSGGDPGWAATDGECTTAAATGVREAVRAVRGLHARIAILDYPVPRRPTRPESLRYSPRVDEGLARAAEAEGVPFVDARACMAEKEAERPWEVLYATDELHLTTPGNAAMAECVGEALPGLLARRREPPAEPGSPPSTSSAAGKSPRRDVREDRARHRVRRDLRAG
jgi:lysophospholipase L1-like esterase